MDEEYIAAMENVLEVYQRTYDEDYPVVCFDERPCFLIGDRVTPLPMQEGKPLREDYTYLKNGSCALLVGVEPLTGIRFAQVYPQRTKKEYAYFLDYLQEQYPKAKKIILVQDNLSTHTKGAFYKYFPTPKAAELSKKFEFVFTPKKGSWLNMAEIELAALSKQCLDRRIPTQQELEKQIAAIVKERNEKRIKISWQFSIQKAREKLYNRYMQVNPEALLNTKQDKT